MSVSIKVAMRCRPFTIDDKLGVVMSQDTPDEGVVELINSDYSTNRFPFSYSWWSAYGWQRHCLGIYLLLLFIFYLTSIYFTSLYFTSLSRWSRETTCRSYEIDRSSQHVWAMWWEDKGGFAGRQRCCALRVWTLWIRCICIYTYTCTCVVFIVIIVFGPSA